MISHLTGTVIHKDERFVILNVAGVGYKVFVPQDTLAEITKKLEGQLELWTYLAVRENALDLYGFLKKEDLDFFELLIAHVSGIGPKTALGILSATTVDTLKRAISSGHADHLIKISGIGKKVAEKTMEELEDEESIVKKVHEELHNLSKRLEAIEEKLPK